MLSRTPLLGPWIKYFGFFGALVRLLFHELLGLQLRRLLRWSSIGAREGHQRSLSMTQPSLGPRTARRHRERPNQQIRRVADHQARPVPELPWGEPGLDCGRFLRLDMPQNRHEEPFPAHMAMK